MSMPKDQANEPIEKFREKDSDEDYSDYRDRMIASYVEQITKILKENIASHNVTINQSVIDSIIDKIKDSYVDKAEELVSAPKAAEADRYQNCYNLAKTYVEDPMHTFRIHLFTDSEFINLLFTYNFKAMPSELSAPTEKTFSKENVQALKEWCEFIMKIAGKTEKDVLDADQWDAFLATKKFRELNTHLEALEKKRAEQPQEDYTQELHNVSNAFIKAITSLPKKEESQPELKEKERLTEEILATIRNRQASRINEPSQRSGYSESLRASVATTSSIAEKPPETPPGIVEKMKAKFLHKPSTIPKPSADSELEQKLKGNVKGLIKQFEPPRPKPR